MLLPTTDSAGITLLALREQYVHYSFGRQGQTFCECFFGKGRLTVLPLCVGPMEGLDTKESSCENAQNQGIGSRLLSRDFQDHRPADAVG